jgi:hypothetical protein
VAEPDVSPAEVARLPRPLPEVVEISTTEMPMHTPRETALIRAMSGKSVLELTGEDAADDERERVLVWFALRRLGFQPSWDDTQDVLIRFVMPDPPKPGEPTNSPGSADSGG